MPQKSLFPEVEETKLLSSGNRLLKWNWVSVDPEDSRVIDNNELLEQRLSQRKQFVPTRLGAKSQEGESPMEEGEGFDGEENGFSTDDDYAPGEFRGGLEYTQLEGILEDPDDQSTLIKAAQPQYQEPVYDGPSPQELIDEANAQIDEMYAKAQEEIEALKANALEEARTQGYDQGYSEGMNAAQAQLQEQSRQLEEDYNRQVKELEPSFVKHITGIYEHIFHVQLSEYQTLVVQLLESCLQKTESSTAYILHVGVEDYPFVTMQKKSLMDIIGGRNATFDIIEDNTLRKNECMIETDGGIYDCSLDAQLKALKRELMTLAYQPE